MEGIPFNLTSAATGEYFIGRKEYMDQLLTLVTDPQCPGLSIFGLARIGKSSIVEELEQRLLVRDNPMKVLRMSLAEQTSYFGFLKYVLHMMKKEFKKAFGRDWLQQQDWYGDLEDLEDNIEEAQYLVKDGLELAKQKGLKFLLVVDEFDAAKEIFKGVPARFQFLRDLKGSRNKLPVIFISRESVENIEEIACGCSLLSASLKPIKMKPFNAEDMEEYYQRLSQAGVNLKEAELAQLKYYCGQFPFFLCHVGYELVRQAEKGSVKVYEAFKNCESSFHKIYDSVLGHLKNEGLYVSFIQTFIGPKYNLQEVDWEKLRARGYIVTEEDDGKITSCKTICQHFVDYIRQTEPPLKSEAWDKLSEAERALRKLVRYGYEQHYPENGYGKLLADVLDKELIPFKKIGYGTDSLGNTCYSFVANNIRLFNDADILKATAIHDLAKVLHYSWADTCRYKQYFYNDNYEVWNPKFSLLDKARIPFAHNNFEFLKSSDLNGVDRYAQEIIEIVDNLEGVADYGPIDCKLYPIRNGKYILVGVGNTVPMAQTSVKPATADLELGQAYTMRCTNANPKFIEGEIQGNKCRCYADRLREKPDFYLEKEIKVKINRYHTAYDCYLVQVME